MRILMLSEFYPPYIGGVEGHVRTLSQELTYRGHHVAVATLEHTGSPAFEDDEGIRVYRLTGWNRVLAPFYESRERQFHLPMPDPGIIAGLRHVVEQERPDIVHAHSWMLYSFVGLKAWSKAKLIMTLHEYGLICPKKSYLHEGQVCTGPGYVKCIGCVNAEQGMMKAALLTTALKLSSPLRRYVDRYLAVGSAVRDACISGTGQPPQTIEIVPSFIPVARVDEANQVGRPSFLPPTDDYILFAGRQNAHAHKGLEVLLEAYKGLSEMAPLVVMIADTGKTPNQFPDGVTVVHNVPHAQVMAGWMHCAIGVVPSIVPESFGQVAVEAMSCGKPVVASAVGGLRDVVVDGETGLLVPPGDAQALREALRTLLLDPSRRAQMGAAGRQRARLFTVGTAVDRIEQIYAELVGENCITDTSKNHEHSESEQTNSDNAVGTAQ